MSHTSSPTIATAPFPDPDSVFTTGSLLDGIRPTLSPTMSGASSESSSGSESEHPPHHSSRPPSRKSRMDRPRLSERQRSSSIIVPKGRDVVQKDKPQYPPNDARAMSPRRNSQDIEKLEQGVRQSLKEQAKTLQSSLAALAEKIDEVKSDHDKLESENRFLQDYIGGLTRTMSKDSNLGRSGSMSGKKKGRR